MTKEGRQTIVVIGVLAIVGYVAYKWVNKPSRGGGSPYVGSGIGPDDYEPYQQQQNPLSSLLGGLAGALKGGGSSGGGGSNSGNNYGQTPDDGSEFNPFSSDIPQSAWDAIPAGSDLPFDTTQTYDLGNGDIVPAYLVNYGPSNPDTPLADPFGLSSGSDYSNVPNYLLADPGGALGFDDNGVDATQGAFITDSNDGSIASVSDFDSGYSQDYNTGDIYSGDFGSSSFGDDGGGDSFGDDSSDWG